jgi:guanylate kinase
MPAQKNNGLLLLISGPSGAGKTTLFESLLSANPGTVRAITCTTRPPRDGEKDGVDYYFLDAGDFLKRVQAGNFLEHATVFGNSYGTLKAEVLNKIRASKDVLLNVDVQGAAAIKARAEDDEELKAALVTIFLAPPSFRTLQERLEKRNLDSPTIIQKRLSVARHEIAQWRHFDYLIVSSTIEHDLEKVQAIMVSEKLRQFRARLPEYES